MKEDRKMYLQEYRKAHVERIREQVSRWQKSHRAQINARRRQRYWSEPEYRRRMISQASAGYYARKLREQANEGTDARTS